MMRTKLDGGATVAFGLLHGKENYPPTMQIEVTDTGPNTYLMVEMTIEQAEDVAANLNAQLDVLNDLIIKHRKHYTDDTQEEAHITSLHPRAEQLLTTAGVAIPPVDMPNPLLIVDNNGKPVRQNVTANHGAEELPAPPSFINVEIDDEWQAHVSEIKPHDEVSAALNSDWDEANEWQRELDQLVDDLVLKPNKRPQDKSNVHFKVMVQSDNKWDGVDMPITVSYHPWVRSVAMRKLVIEVFAQAFRYGASWEMSRNA